MTPEDDARRLPAVIGKYRLVAELGKGGMANVYLAVMRGPHGFSKVVVLKVPRELVLANVDALGMFREEARLAAQLNHPNVVQTYEVVHEDSREFLVMEYLDGQPLHKLVLEARRRGKPLPLGMHLMLICEALRGLHHAHEAKGFDGAPLALVHRDVSPQNIFVTFDGAVKVLDFGIAKAATSNFETAIGTIKGRVRYMSPEHLSGQRLDRRADVFAAGALLWEAAVGERLWRERSDIEVISAVVGNHIPSPKSMRPSVPDALDAIVRKAMAHERGDRHGDCLQLQDEIEGFLRTLPDRYSMSDAAVRMNELFSEIREERRRLIELQLRKVNSQDTAEYVSSRPSLTFHGGTQWPTAVTQWPTGVMQRATSTHVPVTLHSGTVPSPRSKPRARAFSIATILVAGAAAAVVFLRPATEVEPEPTRSGETPVASAPPAARAAEPPAPAKEIVVVVRVEPDDAHLFLDGERVSANPWIHRGAPDPSPHLLRAEAKGYVLRRVDLRLDQDAEIVVRLAKLPVAPAQPARAVRVRPQTSSASIATPLTSRADTNEPPMSSSGSSASSASSNEATSKPGKDARPIDTSNPWGK